MSYPVREYGSSYLKDVHLVLPLYLSTRSAIMAISKRQLNLRPND